jgi:hypothetical protein
MANWIARVRDETKVIRKKTEGRKSDKAVDPNRMSLGLNRLEGNLLTAIITC